MTKAATAITFSDSITVLESVDMLDAAETAKDIDKSGWRLHPLRGQQKGRWAVTVSGNWQRPLA
ncbi:MAG: plasmid maintenance system killer protein [Halieaceae bacterium]|jgi:plasmid maintenance system killer protein